MATDKLPLLLATKLMPPRLPAGLIDRPRLLDLMESATARRLSVLKAPAGFGKTSLATAWLARLRAGGTRTAWLSLDGADDEPARFLHHLAKALRQACSDVGASAIGLTAETSLVPAQTVVATLINELAEVDDEVCLFLDDYHLISLPAIHDAVAFMLAHAPSNFHLIIGTRSDPPLPLARLRAQNELLEIEASMLRFSLDETQRFLEHECAGKLPEPDISTLHAATEGWAAALRISASTLLREKPGGNGWEIVVPSGTARPIAAYIEDMLWQLPDEMVRFMLDTSILDGLTALLCQAVTGLDASQSMLERIATRQLLLEPMDAHGHWFRYHHLLREFLRQRLESGAPENVAALHLRACRWYAARRLWTDAVRHAIAANDNEEAISLLGNCAMALVRKGDLLTLLGWQRQFPAELMRGQDEVRLAIAWGMALAMRFDESAAMLASIEDDMATGVLPGRDNIRWECQAVRAVAAALQDDPRRALAIAQACLDRPASHVWSTNVVSNVVRFAHWKAGDLDRFYATPWIPYSDEDDQRNVFSSVYYFCLLGLAELQQMHFVQAERHFMKSMRLAEHHVGPQSTSAAVCAPLIAQIRYEQDRLDEAEALIADRFPVINAAVMLDSVLVAYLVLVRIALARADTDQAYALLDQAQSLGHARGWNRLIATALIERIRLLLTEGSISEAAACVARLDALAQPSSDPQCSNARQIENYRALGAAYLAMAQNRTQDAVALLNTLLESAGRKHRDYLALRLRCTLAIAFLRANAREQAVGVFREILEAAAAAGVFRTLLDQGPDTGTLLRAGGICVSAVDQAVAEYAACARSRSGDRLSRQAPPDLRHPARAHRAAGQRPEPARHRTRHHRGRDGLGQPPLPRMLFRGADDGRRAADRERPPFAGRDRLHDQPRGRGSAVRAHGFPARGRVDPRQARDRPGLRQHRR
ncbi:LuxR family transcriptional regulator [Cupriavidus necator]|uniref:LuxR family transcriptional regulator n=1 Tax=Cupriavidus necator TaxID=106590 RepID=A0A1U9UVK1_CUPNE|nr:LuxR family transcriptional regulator [Cupriavidus necator]